MTTKIIPEWEVVLKGHWDQCTLSARCLFSEKMGRALQTASLPSETAFSPGDSE